MGKRCCIKSCKSESYGGCGISFHSFPMKNDMMKQKWLDAITVTQKIAKHSVVCSLHFKPADFHIANSRRMVNTDAVPSVFPVTMTPNCSIIGCGISKVGSKPKITLHRLPENDHKKEEWLEIIGIENLCMSKCINICSLHFEESCYNRTLNVMTLRDDAIPTLLLPPAKPDISAISTDESHAQPSLPTDMPPAIRSTSGISTNESHDQPSSAADTPPAVPNTSDISTNNRDQRSSATVMPPAMRSTSSISTKQSRDQPSSATETPPAMRRILSISTKKRQDQPSSATDAAIHDTRYTMKCYVPFCVSGFKTSGESCGISFFKFPKDSYIRKEWVKALGIKNWEANSSFTICSEHFKEESFYETKHGRKMLHPDALPIKNLDPDAPAALMICRICLTVDSNMQYLGKFSQVFSRITGILTADSESCRLPQLLCWECAARLKSAASFRHKALSSDAILRALLKPDTFLRIKDIKTINRKTYGLKTSLVQKLLDPEHYDVKIQDTFIDTDHIKTEYDLEEGIPELLENDAKNDVINYLKEHNYVKTNDNASEKKPEILRNCIPIEDISKICQSDNNIKTVMLENGNEESSSKYLMLQNNDEESNGKFVVLKNSGKENDLKYIMLQNDDCNIESEELMTQNNDKVTKGKEMGDDDILEEYLYFDDDTTEIVGESEIPEEISKIVQEENLKKIYRGVHNVQKARQNKKVSRFPKFPPRKMNNSRSVSGQTKVNNEDISVYENLFDITDITFEQQREEIIKRREHQSYKNAPYKCTVCFRGFLDKSVFDRHTIKHTDTNGKFECTVCKIRKKKRSLLNRHSIITHTREYKCLKCDFVTRHSGAARAHVDFHKGKRFHCKQCPLLVFNKRSTYLGHMRLKHVHSFVCEYCGYTFVSQLGVISHKNLLHKLEKNVECKGPYCNECDVTFLSEEPYYRHLNLSSKHLQDEFDPSRMKNGPTYRPRKPNTIYKRRPTTASKNSDPVIEISNPMTCEQCDEELPNYRMYVRHFLKRHPGLSRTQFLQTTTYICEQCGKMFSSRRGLSGHQWVHTGNKMYQCDHCDKSFTQKSTLRTHLAMVEENESHQCSECGKVFTLFCNLKRHEFIHTGLKPFKCDICSKTFATKDRLKQHTKHTHNKVPWPRKVKRKEVNKI